MFLMKLLDWLIVGDLQVDLRLEDVVAGRDMFVRDVHAKELDTLLCKNLRNESSGSTEESLTSAHAELNDLHSPGSDMQRSHVPGYGSTRRLFKN